MFLLIRVIFCFSRLILPTGIWDGPVISRFCIGASSIQTLETEDYNGKYIQEFKRHLKNKITNDSC
jgi:hypothetical protein